MHFHNIKPHVDGFCNIQQETLHLLNSATHRYGTNPVNYALFWCARL